MKILAYVLTIIGTFIGGYELLATMTLADSAPQQAAGAAMALAWGVLPYCFARAVEKISEVPTVDALDRFFARRPATPAAPTGKLRGVSLGTPTQTEN